MNDWKQELNAKIINLFVKNKLQVALDKVIELINSEYIPKSDVLAAIEQFEKNRGRWANDYARGYADLADHLRTSLHLESK